MTGRDLILYILENHLEDELVIKGDGSLLGFMTVAEAAVKFDVGESTIRAWISLNMLDGVKFGNMYYIPANSKSPLEEVVCKEK